jgi:hypothetical protein
MLPQCLHVIASSWIFSAQYGHFVMRQVPSLHEATQVTEETVEQEKRRNEGRTEKSGAFDALRWWLFD